MTKNTTTFIAKILMSIFSILILGMFFAVGFLSSNEGTSRNMQDFWTTTFLKSGLPVIVVVIVFFLIFIAIFIYEEIRKKRQNEKENILFGIILLIYLSIGVIYGIYWNQFYVFLGIYLQFLFVGIYLLIPPAVWLSHYFYKKRQ